MRGCSGTGEYEAGKEQSQYTHYKKLDYTTAYVPMRNRPNRAYPEKDGSTQTEVDYRSPSV